MELKQQDVEYIKHCAVEEATKACILMDDLLRSLRLLGYNYDNNEKYRTLSDAFMVLGIIGDYGIEVFEVFKSSESEHNAEW